MLNELELAYWQVINKEIGIMEVPNDLFLQRLMMTALLAKSFTTEKPQIDVFKSFLGHNYPIFMQSFTEWEDMMQISADSITLVKVNEEFKELYTNIEDKDSILFIADTKEDFNYVVDYIF
jgi:hypothetical protein